MKLNYFLIPLFIIAISYFGSSVTSGGMAWYKTLVLPAIAPPGYFIGIIWTIIYILVGASAILFWNKNKNDAEFRITALWFVVNGLLNLFWSFVFFKAHFLGWSIVEMSFLNLTTLVLIYRLWRNNRTSAWLLTPYVAWVSFATYLAFLIWKLN